MEHPYIVYFIIGFLGIILHALLKIRSLKLKAKVANEEFNPADYFKEDWLSMVISVIVVIICLFLLGDKGIDKLEKISDWMRFIFLTVGYMGADLASRFFGAVSNKINKAIDIKTDIADGKIHITE